MCLFPYLSEVFESRKRLLLIQCGAGRKYDHLIAYARYRVPLLQETITRQKDPTCLVVFVIYIPRRQIDTSLVGLQGGHWLSAHIDDIREGTIETFSAMGKHISELLCDHESLTSGKVLYSMPLYQRLHSCIQTAASRLHESEEKPSARSTQRINILLDLIPKAAAQSTKHGMCNFYILSFNQLAFELQICKLRCIRTGSSSRTHAGTFQFT